MAGDYHSVAVIPGDLNGVTVTVATLKLADAVSQKLEKPVKRTIMPYNADYFLQRNMTELGPSELGKLRGFDQIFLGAIGDPTRIPPGVLENGILIRIRQAFDQYVNLRPVILPEGVECPIVGKTPADINFEICRENSEGLYVGKGRVESPGTEDEVGIQEMHCSYKGVKRLMDFAVQRALTRKKGPKPTVHIVFKTNVLTKAAVPWNRVFKEYQVRSDVTGVAVKYMHIDNFVMQMITNPAQFDVVITENMFGDIVTDLGAVLQGGIGTAVSGNINPTGAFPSMFEPIHGTAPDKWYVMDEKGEYIPGAFVPEKVQLIRPEAAFLAWAMMLEQMHETAAANAIKSAVLANLRNPDYKDKKLDELVEQACSHVIRG